MSDFIKIQHLYRRAGFGLSPRQWLRAQASTLPAALDELLQKAAKDDFQIDLEGLNSISQIINERKNLSKEQKKMLRKESIGGIIELNNDWLLRMGDSDYSPFREKMCLFWHGHFACKAIFPTFATRHLNMLRQHALGNFGDFLKAIARDGVMINYLNNQQNKKKQPNENFARELMELFSLGRGNYSEMDVKEAARAFTGWGSTIAGVFEFRKRQHDFDTKTIFGKTGNFDGDDVIDMILEKPECAYFIAQKVYRFFVNEVINPTHVQVLADVFYKNNYDINLLMTTLFRSEWFYDAANIGTRIKSPCELVVGIIKTLRVTFPDAQTLFFVQKMLGQTLFNPPNVAGWPGGRTWIDNATLPLRLNLAAYCIQQDEFDLNSKSEAENIDLPKLQKISATVDFSVMQEVFGAIPSEERFSSLAEYLLATPLANHQAILANFIADDNSENHVRTITQAIVCLPEYQMC